MLLEIYCDKFIERNHIRPAVKFHKGLNVVLGNEMGANSIGKSTFLLVIDFAFGGNDYVEKATDVEKNIGPHTVFFAFEFNNHIYHFSRSTQKFQVVNQCDEEYVEKKEIPIDEYKNWLTDQYQITQEGLSFRALVSRFFRIYQRSNLDEQRPLYGGFPEKCSDAITTVEKIFNKFTILSDAQKALKDATEKKKKFTDAQAENYIPAVRSQKEYQEFEKQRNQLSIEQELLSDIELLQSRTASEIQNIYTLKARLQSLRCQSARLGTKISQIKAQLSEKTPTFQDDFRELEHFFNNINLRKIEEIELFHKKLSAILVSELQEELQHALEEQKSLLGEITQAEQELKDFDIPTGISKKILQEYSAKAVQIDRITAQLENYDRLLQLKQDVDGYKKRYEALSKTVLFEIETRINEQMREYNNFIYNGSKEAPVLTLTSNGYEFKTINDSGTGTSYKSLAIFDLSVLKLTNLPAIVHDSLIFKNIGDEPLAKIIELYTMFPEKQIFIAIDKADSYHSPKTQEYLGKNTVLSLSSGSFCLFGRSWSDTSTPGL